MIAWTSAGIDGTWPAEGVEASRQSEAAAANSAFKRAGMRTA
jgi:hypothetical protein